MNVQGNISDQTVHELAKRLCPDLVLGVFSHAGSDFIATRFKYPVGDSINVYAQRTGDAFKVSDMGTTHYILSVAGVEFTDTRRELIETICVRHGLRLDGMTITKMLKPDLVGVEFIQFCEALSQIATLQYDVTQRQSSRLAKEVEALITDKVEPNRGVIRDWTDENFDPHRRHEVDYHCNGVANPSNIYVITSTNKAEKAVAIMRFWESRSPAKSMAIVDPQLELSTATEERLSMAANKIARGVAGNERSIVQFALKK